MGKVGWLKNFGSKDIGAFANSEASLDSLAVHLFEVQGVCAMVHIVTLQTWSGTQNIKMSWNGCLKCSGRGENHSVHSHL